MSPRPYISHRAIAHSRHGVAIVQGLSSRALAREIAFKLANGPEKAIEDVLLKDKKAAYRQAVAISGKGEWYAFTGLGTAEEKGHGQCGSVVYAGNGLKEGSLRTVCSWEGDPLFSVLRAALAVERKGNLWPSKSAALVIWSRGKARVLSVNYSDDPLFEVLVRVRREVIKNELIA